MKDKVAVSAGLLTYASASQLFGGWVAEHFLVVQVTISNQSRDQQFVLHDIFLDYSNWKLSGIYTNSTGDFGNGRPLQDFQQGNQPGHISSIGALEMQDALKQNSVFSKRNFFVNGLVLIGTTAGGFAFLGPTGFTQAVAGYTGSFLPALQKFWPDRRIDQQSNLLKYGFQDKMVVAKEDPGKTYAFFPVERLLTKGLAKLYRDDPALFLNIVQLYLDPSAQKGGKLLYLRYEMDEMILSVIAPRSLQCQERDFTEGKRQNESYCVQNAELATRIFQDLNSPCYYGKWTADNPNGERACDLTSPDSTSANRAPEVNSPGLKEIRAVKDIVQGFSLNTVRVVVSGIMTVDVDLVPAVLTKVEFDDPGAGKKPIWEDTASTHNGIIYGSYLTNGKPTISGIKVPSDPNSKVPPDPSGKPGDYIESLAAVPDQSTDSELHFAVQFKKPIPNGTVLTFQVAKSANKSTNAEGTANTQLTTTSMGLDYSVSYTPSPAAPPAAGAGEPAITDVVLDSPDDLLKAVQLKGHLLGNNLDSWTIGIKITLADGTLADLKTYVDGSAAKAPGSDSKTLNFTLSLKKGLPDGAKVVFEMTSDPAEGKQQAIEAPKTYSVKGKSVTKN